MSLCNAFCEMLRFSAKKIIIEVSSSSHRQSHGKAATPRSCVEGNYVALRRHSLERLTRMPHR